MDFLTNFLTSTQAKERLLQEFELELGYQLGSFEDPDEFFEIFLGAANSTEGNRLLCYILGVPNLETFFNLLSDEEDEEDRDETPLIFEPEN